MFNTKLKKPKYLPPDEFCKVVSRRKNIKRDFSLFQEFTVIFLKIGRIYFFGVYFMAYSTTLIMQIFNRVLRTTPPDFNFDLFCCVN